VNAGVQHSPALPPYDVAQLSTSEAEHGRNSLIVGPDNRSGERREALSSKEDDATISQQSHQRSSASTPCQSECSGTGEGSWTELVERQAKKISRNRA
jgi:hypothetical protein